ncbi:hypothetical protein [Enterovirga rhinocerotis]|uniref:PsiF repeat-containing protein n=1 Tax=Enterovirga rhinocerotis TaxID=1339210 RepID=A0A4R7CBK6_9HYPH|nr:hypothetical protein [Enterovirga rhinocerotis]TDR94137.1 hypothetical protein EV668_1413 [Enterovirga rhinocerotis]
MRSVLLAAASALGLILATPLPASAQTGASPGASPGTSAPAPRAPRAARPKREPTAGQLAARERMRKCAGEWRDAKSKNATGGLKWPQFWSRCNTRMKGNAA